MPRIFMVSLPQDYELAEAIRAGIAQYYPSTKLISNDTSTARAATAVTNALIVLVSGNWVEHIQKHPAYFTAIETALRRSDVLIITVIVNNAPLPKVTDLPGELRAIVYMPTANVSVGESQERDIKRLAAQIHSHFKEVSEEQQRTQPMPASQRSRRGLPCNVVMIVGILLIAAVLLLIPALRGDDTDEPLFADPVAPNNPAVLGQAAPDPEIMIGVAVSLNEANADRGETMLSGVQLALLDRPNITIDGQSFTLDLLIQDTDCSAVGGLDTATLFTSDLNIVGVVGDICNLSCTAASGIYAEAGYTVVSPGCDAPNLTLDDDDMSFNRTVPSQTFIGRAAAQFAMEQLNVNRVTVLHDELILGGQLVDVFTTTWAAAGGEISGDFELETLTVVIDDVIAQVQATQPELIYYAGRARNAALIRQGLPDIPMILGDTTTVDAFITAAGDAAEGVFALTLLPPSGAPLSDLRTRYNTTYTESPDSLIYAYAYDAANMLIDGLEATSRMENGEFVVDREGLMAFIRGYNGEGVTGALNCVGNGNCAEAAWQAQVIQNNERVDFEVD